MAFDPYSLDKSHIEELRKAAEVAWGDDVRSPNFVGHPQPSAGCCMVTSKWLTSRLGGFTGFKQGHWFWVSPDKQFCLDLTGDSNTHEGSIPGPPVFKSIKDPRYKGLRIREVADSDRTRAFSKRADNALAGKLTKRADLMGADAYPGEEPQAVEDMNNRYMHDEPWVSDLPDVNQYKVFWGNGQLHVSPHHTHDELRQHAGVSEDHSGPMASGYAHIQNGRATWTMDTNTSLRGLADVLKQYGKNVGWKWDGLADKDGQLVHEDLGPKKTMYYQAKGDHVQIAENPFKRSRKIDIEGKTASVHALGSIEKQAFYEWANDFGYRLAEVPGGGNMLDRMKNKEWLDTFNNGDPNWEPEKAFDGEPEGPLTCNECGKILPTFRAYQMHADDHAFPMVDQIEDGHFPQPGELDDPLPARRHVNKPMADVIASVMPVASVHEARRVPGFDLYSGMWASTSTDNEHFRHYVAYINGEPLGYVTMQDEKPKLGNLIMICSAVSGRGIGKSLIDKLKQHYDEIKTGAFSTEGKTLITKNGFVETEKGLYKWAAGKEPKDMIVAPIPFVYDIQKDTIALGTPGASSHTIPGQFTPGGIVSGSFEPGGKVIVETSTTVPWSVHHLVSLWYAQNPTLEVTGVFLEDQNSGQQTKLARTSATEIGSYIKTMAATDPAVYRASQALKAAGGKVYVVGGAVRDAFLQKAPKDIDLMVAGLPAEQVDHVLSSLGGRVDLTGKRFGVYRFKTHGSEVEIALPRSDEYSTGRRGEGNITVDHNLPVEKDLERRDFTANSMAVDLDNGQLIDPFGGAKDIQDRTLKTTHPDSFKEDPTRLIRALVASSRHGLVPDEKTRAEMKDNASALDGESPDALKLQLDKLMQSDNPAKAIRIGQDTGILHHMFPELANQWDFNQRNDHHALSLGDHSLSVLENLQKKTKDPDLRLASLLHDVGKPQSEWQDPITGQSHFYAGELNGQPVGADHAAVGADMAENRLRKTFNYPVSRIKRIRGIIDGHMYPDFSTLKGARKFLYNNGEYADDLMTLREADREGKGTDDYQQTNPVDQQRMLVERVRSAQDPTQQSMLSLNGNDLLAMGCPPGSSVGTVLRQLTDAVVADPNANQKPVLTQLAQEYINAIPNAN